jgi:hypothetical protein
MRELIARNNELLGEVREEVRLTREEIRLTREEIRLSREERRQSREDFVQNRELTRQLLVEVVEGRERAREHWDAVSGALTDLAAEIRGWRDGGGSGATA